MCLVVVVLARQLLDLYQRKTAATRRPAPPPSRPGPSGRHQTGSASRASESALTLTGPPTDPAFAMTTDSRGELATLTLQLVAAARPTAQERVQRVSGSVVMVLTPMAAVLALWDLSLLVRGAA